jgi:hypothetical protein
VAQTPPPAPAQGIAGTPAAVAVGVLTTIPIPARPAGGPTPYVFPWVVLFNASPYQIVVSSGSTTVQIAANNADKVFIYPGGGPQVTFVAVAGAGTPLPGGDSTVYSTFYQSEPPGVFPMFIGQSAATAQTSSAIHQTTVALGPTATTRFPTSGQFSTAGFGGATFFLGETSGLGPVKITVSWTDTAGNLLSQRIVICPAANVTSGMAWFTLPHCGPNFFVSITNGNAAVTINYFLDVFQTVLPSASWNTQTGVMIPITSTVCPGGGATTVIGQSLSAYAGPATLSIDPAATAWLLLLQTQSTAGVFGNLQILGPGGIFPAGSGGGVTTVILPPAPVQLAFVNQDAGAHTPLCSLTADDYRIAV